MPCYRPVDCWKPLSGGPVVFKEVKDSRQIQIKCGQCIGCRIIRQESWTMRCLAESQMHDVNSFVTLTYDADHYPQHGSLRYEDFQDFMRALRRKIWPVRFFMCGEYGENLDRPHFHALLFGVDFPDKVKANSIRSNCDIYRSPLLESVWTKGFSSIGEVNITTARYVAAYTIKKIQGDSAADHYSRVNIDTGEIVELEPEFCQMSLKPGIGFTWLEKYWRDLYSCHDAMIVAGKKRKIPRYFDEKMDELMPLLMDSVEFDRVKKAALRAVDNTPERLAVRERVENARVSFNRERKGVKSEV